MLCWRCSTRSRSGCGGWLAGALALLGAACSDGGTEPPPADAGAACYDDELDDPVFGGEDLTFHVGPYLGHTTSSSVAIGWETLDSGDTRVEYGSDDGYGQTADGEAGTMHQLVIEGLEPATTYHYRACTAKRCTRDLTFTTAPPPGHPPRFSIWSDTQENPDMHRAVAEQVMGDAPHLTLVLGDLVGDGQFREEYKDLFFDPPAVAVAASTRRSAATQRC